MTKALIITEIETHFPALTVAQRSWITEAIVNTKGKQSRRNSNRTDRRKTECVESSPESIHRDSLPRAGRQSPPLEPIPASKHTFDKAQLAAILEIFQSCQANTITTMPLQPASPPPITVSQPANPSPSILSEPANSPSIIPSMPVNPRPIEPPRQAIPQLVATALPAEDRLPRKKPSEKQLLLDADKDASNARKAVVQEVQAEKNRKRKATEEAASDCAKRLAMIRGKNVLSELNGNVSCGIEGGTTSVVTMAPVNSSKSRVIRATKGRGKAKGMKK